MQVTRLNATNSLITGIRVNGVITNEEAEAGVTSLSSEDGEVEEDDG